jgi:hypothetical protein
MLFSLGEIFGGTGVSPVRAQAKACGYLLIFLFLVPKYTLGTRGMDVEQPPSAVL